MSEKKTKKPFKETGLGQFLNKAEKHLGTIVDVASNVAKGDISGAIDAIKGDLQEKGKTDARAMELYYELENKKLDFALEIERIEVTFEQEITKRWEADANSGNKLVLMTRPLIVLYSVFFTTVVAVIDSIPGINLVIADKWIDILEMLLITSIGGYFAARSLDKYTKSKSK